MWEIWILCYELDRYVKTRSLSSHHTDLRKVLARGLAKDERDDFINTFRKGKDFSIVEDQISDALKRDFLSELRYSSPYGEEKRALSLGEKGRRLVRGRWYTRWASFLTFSYERYSPISGFLLGAATTGTVWLIHYFFPTLTKGWHAI
jgi:hypothetical protein